MIGAISLDNQRKLLEGILSWCKQNQTIAYVFTNHVSYFESEAGKQGAFQISVSLGLSEYQAIQIDNIGSLIEQADALMYEQKKAHHRNKK